MLYPWLALRRTEVESLRAKEAACGQEPRPWSALTCSFKVWPVARIIDSIFLRFNLEWENRALRVFTEAVSSHRPPRALFDPVGCICYN